jgi:hypothetical protein
MEIIVILNQNLAGSYKLDCRAMALSDVNPPDAMGQGTTPIDCNNIRQIPPLTTSSLKFDAAISVREITS